jgi:hypothetical protein
MTFEQPIKGDLDRTLSFLMHDHRHKLMEQCNLIKSDAVKSGALHSSRVVVMAIKAADDLHKEAITQASTILLDYIGRMQRPPAEIVGWARPHLENLGNSLLGVVPPNNFPQDHQRLVHQYRAVFGQRLDGMLRDVEIGFVREAGFARDEQMENSERAASQAGKDFICCVKCDERVPFRDDVEECRGPELVAREVVAMDELATQELDAQALEQILIGHMQAICGEANQIFRELTKFDYGIDGEVEFKDSGGKPSGKKIYVQLKSGASHLRKRKSDSKEVFDVKDSRHLEYWVSQPVDVYLVIRDAEETIRWMNLTRYLKGRRDKTSRQIVFVGEKLDSEAVCRLRNEFFPPL